MFASVLRCSTSSQRGSRHPLVDESRGGSRVGTDTGANECTTESEVVVAVEIMGWATAYIAKLKAGETVQFRPRGGSMAGKT